MSSRTTAECRDARSVNVLSHHTDTTVLLRLHSHTVGSCTFHPCIGLHRHTCILYIHAASRLRCYSLSELVGNLMQRALFLAEVPPVEKVFLF